MELEHGELLGNGGLELVLPPNSLTTDNAAMIAFAGLLRAREGDFSPLDTPVDPNMKLAGAQTRK